MGRLHAMEPNFFHGGITGFTPLLREHDNPYSLGEAFINAIYEDHDKVLWISTTGALVQIDPATEKHTFYRLPGESGGDDIIAITEDKAGALWVGTTGAGPNRFDRKTGKYTSYRHDTQNPHSISSDVVSRIAVDDDGQLWLSTWDGPDRFDPRSGRAVVYRYYPGRTEHLFNVTIAPDKTLWMGAFSGLYHFDPTTERFKVYSHSSVDTDSLSDNVVNSVLVGQSGHVWAATENGLLRLDTTTGFFQRCSVKDGLASNALSCVLEDQEGKLWISSNQGVTAFSSSTRGFQNFSAADGISSVDLTGGMRATRARVDGCS